MKSGEGIEIAFFLPSLRGGGAERVMLDLACGFHRKGHRVDLVLAKAEGAFLSRVPDDMRVVDLNSSRVLSSFPGLVEYLRRERPSALLSTLGHANLVAILAGMLAGKTRVIIREATTGSHPVYRSQSPLRFHVLRLLARHFYPKAFAVVAVSSGVSDDLVSSLNLSRDRIQLIYNPVITPELFELGAEPLEHPWFQKDELPVILSVGRLSAEKDFSLLLKAFARVIRTHPSRLVILGEGNERAELEREIRDLGLVEHVALPGFAENPFAYMARSSVYALSSVCEGLPNALIQAVALGVPVVSTDCPSGPSEILEQGKFGRLVPVGDEVALAEALVQALSQSALPIPKEYLEPFTASKVLKSYGSLLLGETYA